MKHFFVPPKFLILLLLPVLTACLESEKFCSLGKSPAEAVPPSSSYIPDNRKVSYDSLIYVCGVDFPEGYDWQKDTAMGLGRGKVIFYRNHKEALTLPVGYEYATSSDADTHHIIGGHLYTEFSDVRATTVKKDGQSFLNFDGREYLLGLLETADGCYTLGRDRNTAAVTLRLNGKKLLSKQGITVFGSFQDETYPDTGALYDCGGHCVFLYKRPDTALSCFLVEDGREKAVPFSDMFGSNIHDAKVIDDTLRLVSGTRKGGFIFGPADAPDIYGENFSWSNLKIQEAGGFGAVVCGNAGRSSKVYSPEYEIGSSDSRECVFLGRNHLFHLYSLNPEGCLKLTRNTICNLSSMILEARTPTDTSRRPYLLIDRRDTVRYRLNGYFTGIRAAVNQTIGGS